MYRGHDGLQEWFRSWYEAWAELVDQCEELIDAGEHVVSVSSVRGRGRASGLEVTSKQYAGVWTIREGKVVRVVWYPTREEALEAWGCGLGAAEQTLRKAGVLPVPAGPGEQSRW